MTNRFLFQRFIAILFFALLFLFLDSDSSGLLFAAAIPGSIPRQIHFNDAWDLYKGGHKAGPNPRFGKGGPGRRPLAGGGVGPVFLAINVLVKPDSFMIVSMHKLKKCVLLAFLLFRIKILLYCNLFLLYCNFNLP